ncbi:hypothetical protein ACFYPH_16065, partial [Micromonospora sp. NPDC005252]
LYKHPVEFSKNNHTPIRRPNQWATIPGLFVPVLGAFQRQTLLLRYPLVSAVSNRCFAVRRALTRVAGTMSRPACAALVTVVAGRPQRFPACSPVSLPADYFTRSVPPHQIRLAAFSVGTTRRDPAGEPA